MLALIGGLDKKSSEKYTASSDIDLACQEIKELKMENQVLFSFIDDLSIMRKCEIDRFVVRKFVPADFSLINDWYNRVLKRKEIIRNPTLLDQSSVDFILSDRNLELKNFKKVFEFQKVDVWEKINE